MFDEVFNNPVIVLAEAPGVPVRKLKKSLCSECQHYKRLKESFLCSVCFKKQNEHLKTIVRDVETDKETDFAYTVRKARELGLDYTKKDIKNLLYRGYTPELILETHNVWTRGSEASKALPMAYHNFGL